MTYVLRPGSPRTLHPLVKVRVNDWTLSSRRSTRDVALASRIENSGIGGKVSKEVSIPSPRTSPVPRAKTKQNWDVRSPSSVGHQTVLGQFYDISDWVTILG